MLRTTSQTQIARRLAYPTAGAPPSQHGRPSACGHSQLSSRQACALQFARTGFGNFTRRAQRWSSSLSTHNEDTPAQTKKRTSNSYKISTFKPSEYSVKDILDMSGKPRRRFSFTGFPKSDYEFRYKTHGPTLRRGDVQRIPFPPNSIGIFYFHDRTSVHPVAGDIRFRVLPMDSVKGDASIDTTDLFARGHDLLDHSGLRPWRVSLLSIMSRKPRDLYSFMKAHGHITDAAEMQIQSLRSTFPSRTGSGSKEQIVEQITDPFILDLSKTAESLIFFHKEGIIPSGFPTWQAITKRQRGVETSSGRGTMVSYTGTVLVRFEVIRQGIQSRVVVRVLKYIKPPNPGDAVVQEEGELLKKYNPIDRVEVPWVARFIPKFLTPSSLKLLEEAYIFKGTTG
ncbi:hypothetical protein FA13DRAFT_1779746 [Coprinellus micaceus]|uniref:Uncharacterized protein n=1 Tax=Coprinellus micaceus TaxID=71717 RepID=A0A4Y7SGD5_COPMI|nr:hypothetical protein FA13DRAFT_1779746 [Coprinellus micaceus]